MIVAENLKKVYSRVTAIQGVSFNVEEGEILGFLGPNGAGKSTTMRILTGFTPATEGKAIIAGFDVHENPIAARKNIGYLPENTPLYHEMSVISYLGFVSEIKGIPSGERASCIREAMEESGIAKVSHRTIGKLSKGYRQRVGLAQAILGNPRVLILDEPTVGLDPSQIREIRDLIKNMAGKRTVILSTHILPEVSMICKRVLIIHNGRIVASDAVGELTKRVANSRKVRLILKAPPTEINDTFAELQGIQKIECQELLGENGLCDVSLETDPDKDLRPELANRIVGKGWGLYEIRSMDPTLEDIFVQIVAGKNFIGDNFNEEYVAEENTASEREGS